MNIKYHQAILSNIFKCKCGQPLLMFGCGNKHCSNYYKTNLIEVKLSKSRIDNESIIFKFDYEKGSVS